MKVSHSVIAKLNEGDHGFRVCVFFPRLQYLFFLLSEI